MFASGNVFYNCTRAYLLFILLGTEVKICVCFYDCAWGVLLFKVGLEAYRYTFS